MRRTALSLLAVLVGLSSITLRAAVSVNLTILEALYPGSTSGVARTDAPVTVGVPLPDDAATGVTGTGSLGLTGASVGQFRVLGTWPSGRAKWVLIDTQLGSLSAGATSTAITLTSSGSGNFGGSDLATDAGSTITVDTGAADFTIRKANFNGFHEVVVGSTTVVSAGASTGLVVVGPTAGNTTCGTCTTIYSSANDAGSTCSIEENGPVRAAVKCTGDYEDGSGNVYMHFTVRLHFYKGLARVRAVAALRNADLGASSSFAVAFKGMAANEWRLTANISGTRTFQIGEHGGAVETGTLSGSDDVYLYQADNAIMEESQWDSISPHPTSDTGYVIVKNGNTGSPLGSGNSTVAQASAGWADIRDSSGVGVLIGTYQAAAYAPKSLEFASGGSEVRVGIWPRQNSRTYHQPWPQWSTHDLSFTFHDAALGSPANEFLQAQHPLLAHAAYTHYNTTLVFGSLFRMAAPAVEQAFYEDAVTAAVPTLGAQWPYLDRGITNANFPLTVHHAKVWGEPGQYNQLEHRWSFLWNFITRGMTGRYLDAVHFYRFIADAAFARSDGYSWVGQSGLTSQGFPSRTSANSAEGLDPAATTWIDTLHPHWYGIGDFYFATGDEFLKDAILDGITDYFTATSTFATLGTLISTRAVGIHLIGSARLAQFLRDVDEDASATTVLANGETLYELEVQPAMCTEDSETALGCSYPGGYDETSPRGTSTLRGVHWAYGGVNNWCGVSAAWRATSSFNNALLVQGLLEFRIQNGSGWADYWQALDYAYGISTASLTETYHDNGTGRWDDSGFRPFVRLDDANACGMAESNYDPAVIYTEWMHFLVQHLLTGETAGWSSKLRTVLQKGFGGLQNNWTEFGSYQLSTLASILSSPGSTTLQALLITSFVDNGGGSYTIGWVVPSGAQSYRIKWSPQTLVEWLDFDAGAYTYGVDPVTNRPWFSATNHLPPSPGGTGTTQTTTISTGETGLSASNFSVKAYVGAENRKVRFRLSPP